MHGTYTVPGPGHTTHDQIEVLKGRMQELLSVAAMALRHRVDGYSRRATTTFFQLAQHLNCATGYDAIALLKRRLVGRGVPLLSTSSMLPFACQDGC